jgi:hypothetical protein
MFVSSKKRRRIGTEISPGAVIVGYFHVPVRGGIDRVHRQNKLPVAV